tara:strand:+ start:1411 stop:2199 length:789 start_codon:yes stop_codon:yes gene_type:complete
MATQVNKTFVFPVPTDWMGSEQSDISVGVATYIGPKNLVLWMELDENNDKTNNILATEDPSRSDYPDTLAANIYTVALDADKYPATAAALYGGIAGPNFIEVVVGPSSDPNPWIRDPAHFSEVYDLESFGWDHTLNSGAGGWKTPKFSQERNPTNAPGVEKDEQIWGWDWVRSIRNSMLGSSDSRIPEDAPEEFKKAWKDYRTKLRNLPSDWVGVGTATHLIVWPRDPDVVAQDAINKANHALPKDDPNYHDGVLPGEDPNS